jgi:hypothetical protein
MHNDEAGARRSGSVQTVEIIVALLFIGVAGIVIYDSLRVGISWADDGPQAGYFPFYIGLIMGAASIINLLRAWRSHTLAAQTFSSARQLRQVLAVLLPSMLFVAAIYWVGIYLAAALFIAGFMLWQGAGRLYTLLLVSTGVPVVLFLLFEKWFLVPLPKGPLEAWLVL